MGILGSKIKGMLGKVFSNVGKGGNTSAQAHPYPEALFEGFTPEQRELGLEILSQASVDSRMVMNRSELLQQVCDEQKFRAEAGLVSTRPEVEEFDPEKRIEMSVEDMQALMQSTLD